MADERRIDAIGLQVAYRHTDEARRVNQLLLQAAYRFTDTNRRLDQLLLQVAYLEGRQWEVIEGAAFIWDDASVDVAAKDVYFIKTFQVGRGFVSQALIYFNADFEADVYFNGAFIAHYEVDLDAETVAVETYNIGRDRVRVGEENRLQVKATNEAGTRGMIQFKVLIS